MNVNIFIAFLAGFISFLSPCIFPIIPSYIGYIGAATYDDGYTRNRGAIPLILSFIIGFSIVFAIMGIAFSTLGFAFQRYSIVISRVSGIIVIVLGLNTIFNFISFLDYEKRVDFRIKNKGIVSSILLGMAFGAGWSPCIGPILATILFMAGNSTTLLSGAILLTFFSLGLGIPFFISGLFITKFREKSIGIKKHLGKIRVGSGILIVLIGVLIFFNKLSNINILLSQWGNDFSGWYIINFQIYNIIVGAIFILFSILSMYRSKKRIILIILGTILLCVGFLSAFNVINWGALVLNYLTFQGI
ncbi:MAG: cytochrome c biogenesis protein CcdA [Spirochaetaceae bacterium]